MLTSHFCNLNEAAKTNTMPLQINNTVYMPIFQCAIDYQLQDGAFALRSKKLFVHQFVVNILQEFIDGQVH